LLSLTALGTAIEGSGADYGDAAIGICFALYPEMHRFLWAIIAILPFVNLQAAEQILMACDQPKVSGLYKQCQEVRLVQNIGDRVRVFSRPENRLLTLERNQIFIAHTPSQNAQFATREIVAIPGSYLWNNSPEGFQSLCKVESDSGQKLLTVSCGRHKNELIQKSRVFVLMPFRQVETQPTNYSKK